MQLFNQHLSFVHLLSMTGLCFNKCVGTIEKNKYAFMKTISKNEEQNVYRQFTTPYKRNHILTCGANCGKDESCLGIDVCDSRICRLWNASFYQNISTNNSNELCRRYIKASMLDKFQQSTLSGIEMITNQTITSPKQDKTSVSDKASQNLPYELASFSFDTSTNEVTRVYTASTNAQTTEIESHLYQAKANTTDIVSTTEVHTVTDRSSSTDTTNLDPTITKTTNTSTADKITSDLQTSSQTSDTTSSGQQMTETSQHTSDAITSDGLTTETPSPTGNTTSDVIKTQSSSLPGITTIDVMTTETSSSTISTATDVMTTETSSSTTSTTTDVMTTETSNTTTSPNIQSTQSLTNEIHLATTNDSFSSETSTSTVSDNELYTSVGVITTDSPDQICTMAYEFSGGNHEVPCYNATYSWIIIQRRFDGSVDFYRNWTEYEKGFGSPQSEIWLGNQYIHELTSDGYTVLRIELTRFDGEKRHIEYDFSIENKINHYRLHISERNRSGIDSLQNSDLAFFCTFDKDNDNWNSVNCADLSEKASGWWHSKTAWCTDGNLNGIYTDQYMNYQQGVYWFELGGQGTLKETKMMLRNP